MANKICKKCGCELLNVHPNTVYCSSCKNTINKQASKNFKDKEREKRQVILKEEYINNLISIKEPQYLTTKGFDLVSSIKVKSYLNLFNLNWIDILKENNRFDELFNYIINEFKNFSQNNRYLSVRKFIKYNKLATYDLLDNIGFELIREKCDVTKAKYTEQDFGDNFNYVKNIIGEIPLYKEFEDNTKIPINTYADFFKFKGVVYDNIVEMYVTPAEFRTFKWVQKKYKFFIAESYKELYTGKYKISNEELEIGFKSVFDKCFEDFKTYPTRNYFNKMSKHEAGVYYKRFNLTWSEISLFYGYKLTERNPAELIVLNSIANILNTTFKRHKTWDWLLGISNGKMHCDGYYPEFNLVIEFDGDQHRMPIKKYGGEERFIINQQNDKRKDELLKNHNINLIRISSRSPWHNIEYLKDVLLQNNIIQNINV